MFEAWDTFYLLIGTSAGALLGIMFVVTTLTADSEIEQVERGTAVFLTPTVFHFGSVLAVCAIVVAPDHLVRVLAIAIGCLGLAGAVYAVSTTRRLFHKASAYQPTRVDRVFFGGLPALLYLLLAGGGAAIWLLPSVAAELLAGDLLLLLLLAVRNAWDLATFSLRIQSMKRQGRDPFAESEQSARKSPKAGAERR